MLKSKIAAGITIFIFFTLTTSILVAGMIINYKKRDTKSNQPNSNQLLGISNENEQKDTSYVDTKITTELVSLHNSANDCWLTISDSVYSVSSYLNIHPGGKNEMLKYCGKDATNAFGSKDKSPPVNHSRNAINLLKNYYIGKLGDTIKIVTNTKLPTNTIIPTTGVLPSLIPTISPQSVNSNKSVNLTAAEVTIHNSQVDCWMIISGNVYNLTSYISQHPGGLVMVASCGRDGTAAFQSRGGSGIHSSYANSLLNKYLIGPLNSTTSGSSTTSTTTTLSQKEYQSPSSEIPAPILSKYPDAIYIKGKYEDDGEWEGKINVSGICRVIKIDSSELIVEDKNC